MSIRTYVYDNLNAEERVEILKRPRVDFTSILGTVAPIVDAVATRGDAAVREYTSKFDGVDLDAVVVRVEDLPDPILDDDVRERLRAAQLGSLTPIDDVRSQADYRAEVFHRLVVQAAAETRS